MPPVLKLTAVDTLTTVDTLTAVDTIKTGVDFMTRTFFYT